MSVPKGPIKQKGRGFWGPPQWTALHSIAAAYKPCKKQAFKNYIEALCFLLPCDKCCEHLTNNLTKYPLDPYLGNNHDLFFWTYLLHDAVNQAHNIHKKVGDPPKYSPPFDDVKAYYYRALGEDCTDCQTK
jgi:hypothetical protein